MSAAKSKKTVGLLAGTFLAASLSLGAPAPKLYGSIVGLVSDSAGIPQMGASVVLYSRFDRLLQRVLTTEKGAFGFQALAPGVYTVRVSLTSFLPALKRDILVQPGMQSLLNVSLASVFSSIELVGMAPGDNPIMSDDWKWVLRSASATRPVLRLLPDPGLGSPPVHETTAAALFSDTRGLVQLSAGDQGQTSSLGAEPDLGTAFAVATSFLGRNQVQMSGDVGYSSYSGARPRLSTLASGASWLLARAPKCSSRCGKCSCPRAPVRRG